MLGAVVNVREYDGLGSHAMAPTGVILRALFTDAGRIPADTNDVRAGAACPHRACATRTIRTAWSLQGAVVIGTVVIFGAGASEPFFLPPLSTASLTELVRDWSKWDDILSRYHAIARLANPIQLPAIRELLNRIQKVCDDPNFEDITDIIDKVASYHFDHTHHKSLHAAIACLEPSLLRYPTHAWTAVPSAYSLVHGY